MLDHLEKSIYFIQIDKVNQVDPSFPNRIQI